jgi:RHS repeat-associated protein
LQQGISSKAAGRLENKIKYNGIALEKALDLNVYDAQFRELDPQVGRWWEIDPKTDEMYMWSTYASNFDNPIRFEDHLGDEPGSCCPQAIGFYQSSQRTAAQYGPYGKAVVAGGIIVAGVIAAGEVVADNQDVFTGGGRSMSYPATMDLAIKAGPVSHNNPVGASAPPAMSAAASTGIKIFVAQMKRAQAANAAASSTTSAGSTNPTNGKGGNQTAGSGKSANKLQPDQSAQGDHTTFARDNNGNIYKYQEWKKNDRNPNSFDPGKRFDGGTESGKAGSPHFDKKTGGYIATPHVNESKSLVRPPENKELPQNYRFFPGLY